MAKHILGVLGVIAASVLLLVSAAMNYRFGFSLGKTPADGQIYGAASAAADCFKALVPFFFFAAWRNRMWSQAFAAAVVWVVVTGYSMTSALGHAALNRLDITGQRAAASADYKDMRADTKRAQDQLTWIPAHRPPETVAAELNVHKAQRYWLVTKECTEVTGKSAREYCQQFHKLSAELASGREAQKLETRISDIGTKLARAAGGTVMAEADPQASVLAKVTGVELRDSADGPGALRRAADRDRIGLRHVRGLCLLAHAWPRAADSRGSALQRRRWLRCARPSERWPCRLPKPLKRMTPRPCRHRHSRRRPRALAPTTIARRPSACCPTATCSGSIARKSLASDGTSITLNDLYNSYCNWSEDQEKEPLAMPTFSREFRALGVRKEKIGGRVRYFDIALRSEQEAASDSKLAATKAA